MNKEDLINLAEVWKDDVRYNEVCQGKERHWTRCVVERGFFVSACWTFLEALQTSRTIASQCELEAAHLQLLCEKGTVAIEKNVSTEGNSDRKRKAPTSVERPAKGLRRSTSCRAALGCPLWTS